MPLWRACFSAGNRYTKDKMESLARLVVLIALAITAMIMAGCALLWAAVLRRRFPGLSARWWLLWVPLLFGFSFLLALVVLRLLATINA